MNRIAETRKLIVPFLEERGSAEISAMQKYVEESLNISIKNSTFYNIIRNLKKEGIIDKTCCFEVKRVKNISKREVQILSNKQLKQLFRVLKNRYPYLLPLVEKMIITKQPLNSLLTGDENKKEILK